MYDRPARFGNVDEAARIADPTEVLDLGGGDSNPQG